MEGVLEKYWSNGGGGRRQEEEWSGEGGWRRVLGLGKVGQKPGNENKNNKGKWGSRFKRKSNPTYSNKEWREEGGKKRQEEQGNGGGGGGRGRGREDDERLYVFIE